MKPPAAFALLAALVALGAPAAQAQAPAAPAPETPAPMLRAQQLDFTSKITGRAYRVFISRPVIPGPPGGYPVVYMFDANANFGTVSEAARLLSSAGEARAAVIVGIGYPTDSLLAVTALRLKDLTTPTTAERLAAGPPSAGLTPANTGNLDAFLQVVAQEVKPLVAARMKIDPADQTLFGHSLGGLAVLRALFTEPTAYRTYVAASPSIWWDGKSVLEGEAALVAKVRRQEVQPRVFISVGELEQKVRVATPGKTLAESQAIADQFRMVGNVTDLGARLAKVKGGPGYKVVTQVFPEETHMSVVYPVVSRALRFALEPAPATSPPAPAAK